jgi:hypothetical protein
MERDVIINKILRDLKAFELIKDDDCGHIRKHLELLYGAAWWEGRRSLGGHKRVKLELYIYDIFKDSFDSEKEAVRISKDSEMTIKRSLRSGRATKKGHIWKYKDKENAGEPKKLRH